MINPARHIASSRFTPPVAAVILICTFLCRSASPAAWAEPSAQIVGTLANDYLTVDLYAEGGFRARLSYDPAIWITFPGDTGILSLKTGQAEYRLYPDPTKGVMVASHLRLAGNVDEITWVVDRLQVAQRLRLVAESLYIIFEIANLGSADTSAKLRLLIDTQLVWNDGAPIYVEGYGTFTHEAFFTFPENLTFNRWWAHSSPEDNVRSVCHLLTRPYQVAVAYWGTARNTIFEYQTSPSRPFFRTGHLKNPESDSCVLMYFSLERLQPRTPQKITITYGAP